jgi:hypothetical protein
VPFQLDKSALVEHNINMGHHIQLYNNNILAKISRCMDQITREAVEIQLFSRT